MGIQFNVGDVGYYGPHHSKVIIEKVYNTRLLIRMKNGNLLSCPQKDVMDKIDMYRYIEDRLYSNMCASCENAHACHNNCENCEEYETELRNQEVRYEFN